MTTFDERAQAEIDRRENGHDEPRTLRGIDFGDMQPHLLDGYLIKGLLGRNALVAIIGTSGSGKTFFAADIAVHIAARQSWRGHAVDGGLVIYAALEGPVSAENRFVACRTGGGFAPTTPLRLTPGPVNLRAPEDVAALIAFAKQAESDFGEKCVAVFIDTLSRAIAGGDENGPEDMGALIAGADAVRAATGATVVLVHHFGKDESRGGRGHSSFKCALDTEIEVSGLTDPRIVTVTKQRDLPAGTRFAFCLKVVELGRDNDGDPVTTCIVKPTDPPATERQQPAGKNQAALLAGLTEWQRQHPEADIISGIELREIGKAQGLPRKRLHEAIGGLEKFGWVQPCIGGFRILPEAISP
jgi:hypothetical protein